MKPPAQEPVGLCVRTVAAGGEEQVGEDHTFPLSTHGYVSSCYKYLTGCTDGSFPPQAAHLTLPQHILLKRGKKKGKNKFSLL